MPNALPHLYLDPVIVYPRCPDSCVELLEGPDVFEFLPPGERTIPYGASVMESLFIERNRFVAFPLVRIAVPHPLEGYDELRTEGACVVYDGFAKVPFCWKLGLEV